MDTTLLETLKSCGFDERIDTLIDASRQRGEITLAEVQEVLPDSVRHSPALLQKAMVGLLRSLPSLGVRLRASLSKPSVPSVEKAITPPPAVPHLKRKDAAVATEKPKHIRTTRRTSVRQTEVAELTQQNSSFCRLLELYDQSIGNDGVCESLWTKLEALAEKPIDFVRLYFRAQAKEEAGYLARIKALEAPPEEWLKAIFVTEQNVVSEVILRKVPREQWLRWMCQATGTERVHLESLLK